MVVGDSPQNYLYRFESDTGVYNLGRWMSGLVSGLQNQPRLFESGTALNTIVKDRVTSKTIKI